VVAGNVPQGFTDLGQKTQVMMRLYQFLMTLFLVPLNGADSEFFQV